MKSCPMLIPRRARGFDLNGVNSSAGFNWGLGRDFTGVGEGLGEIIGVTPVGFDNGDETGNGAPGHFEWMTELEVFAYLAETKE